MDAIKKNGCSFQFLFYYFIIFVMFYMMCV